MTEELDFIQPKKVVGKMISVDVLKEIREKIENIDDWEVVNGAVYVRDFYVKEIIDEAIWRQKA